MLDAGLRLLGRVTTLKTLPTVVPQTGAGSQRTREGTPPARRTLAKKNSGGAKRKQTWRRPSISCMCLQRGNLRATSLSPLQRRSPPSGHREPAPCTATPSPPLQLTVFTRPPVPLQAHQPMHPLRRRQLPSPLPLPAPPQPMSASPTALLLLRFGVPMAAARNSRPAGHSRTTYACSIPTSMRPPSRVIASQAARSTVVT